MLTLLSDVLHQTSHGGYITLQHHLQVHSVFLNGEFLPHYMMSLAFVFL